MERQGFAGGQQVTLRSPYGLPPYHLPQEGAYFGGNGKPGILIVAEGKNN